MWRHTARGVTSHGTWCDGDIHILTSGHSPFLIINFGLSFTEFSQGIWDLDFFGDTRDLMEQLPVEKRLILIFLQMIRKIGTFSILLSVYGHRPFHKIEKFYIKKTKRFRSFVCGLKHVMLINRKRWSVDFWTKIKIWVFERLEINIKIHIQLNDCSSAVSVIRSLFQVNFETAFFIDLVIRFNAWAGWAGHSVVGRY